MKGKNILMVITGLLLLTNAYALYNGYLMQNRISDLSARLAEADKQTGDARTDALALEKENTVLNETLKDLGAGSAPKKTPAASQSILPQNPGPYTAEKTIPLVAVSSDGTGVMGNLTVKLMPGNGDVLINTNAFLETDLQYSANQAVKEAEAATGLGKDKDYIFDYGAGDAKLIGGGSAGAAATIDIIAALENKTIRNDTAITGTIEDGGRIGNIAGQMEKAKAVADAGYKKFLIPIGQSQVSVLERQAVQVQNRFGNMVTRYRYVQNTTDLAQTAKDDWGLEVTEVGTIEDAMKYMIE